MKTQQVKTSSFRVLVAALSLGLLLGGVSLAQAESHDRRGDQDRDFSRQTDRARDNARDSSAHPGQFNGKDSRRVRHQAPAVGTVIARIPTGHIRISIGGIPCFLVGETYYRPVRRGYQVMEAPRHQANRGRVAVEIKRLNIRSGPGRQFPVIAVAHRGETLHVAGSTPGWQYVQLSQGRYGWVMSRYTQAPARG
ncbi:MAG TPA: SH3 domain-containing protein [Deferrimonas sp.]|jgi:uncharacterized protein YgiM (DUF1202 family)